MASLCLNRFQVNKTDKRSGVKAAGHKKRLEQVPSSPALPRITSGAPSLLPNKACLDPFILITEQGPPGPFILPNKARLDLLYYRTRPAWTFYSTEQGLPGPYILPNKACSDLIYYQTRAAWTLYITKESLPGSFILPNKACLDFLYYRTRPGPLITLKPSGGLARAGFVGNSTTA